MGIILAHSDTSKPYQLEEYHVSMQKRADLLDYSYRVSGTSTDHTEPCPKRSHRQQLCYCNQRECS